MIKFMQPCFDGEDIPIWVNPSQVAFLVDMTPTEALSEKSQGPLTLISFGGDARTVRGTVAEVVNRLFVQP